MASVEECEAALRGLAERLSSIDERTREQHAVDRTVSLWVSDLKEVFRARIGAHGIADLERGGKHDHQRDERELHDRRHVPLAQGADGAMQRLLEVQQQHHGAGDHDSRGIAAIRSATSWRRWTNSR